MRRGLAVVLSTFVILAWWYCHEFIAIAIEEGSPTENGDVNGDCKRDISDAVYLLLFNFMGGPAPASPFPDCGPGELPTDVELGCEGSPEACA